MNWNLSKMNWKSTVEKETLFLWVKLQKSLDTQLNAPM